MHPEHDLTDQVVHMRRKLERAGVKVHDVRHRYDELDRATEYSISGADLRHNTRRVEIDTTWDLEIDHDQVVHILEVDAQLGDLHRDHQELSQRHLNVNTAYSTATYKTDRLRKTLADNPGIRDQWEEMMVMLKIAGFDQDLLKTD
jgi:hypothetical protein